MDEFEEWAAVDQKVTVLILDRDRQGARALLKQSAEAAAAKNQVDFASHFAVCLAALAAADQLNDAALAAYNWAEQLAPLDGRRKVDTANFFLTFLDKPAEALAKAEEAILLLENDTQHKYALTDALAIRAIAHLELGDEEFAISQFREWSSAERLSRVGSGACDLRLASALFAAGVLKDEVVPYVKNVLQKAQDQGNEHLIGEIERRLSGWSAG